MSLNILLIPLDNRPVTYDLPAQTASICQDVNVFLPPKEFLGDLQVNSDVNGILNWLEEVLKSNSIDYILCSLDTIAYGGLIPSRRSNDVEDEIKDRLNKFKSIILNNKNKNLKIHGFSSIMRISDNNVNEEEKEYWNKYGRFLFKYSYLRHKILEERDEFDEIELKDIESKIPESIIGDYFKTRHRNFSINKYYLDWLQEKTLDFLVYSKDDSGKWGINIQEANNLEKIIKQEELFGKAKVQTGADEILLALISRVILENSNFKAKIFPVYSTENGKNIISRYEDRTVEKSVKAQIELCGADIAKSEEDADLILLVHTPEKVQNDHAMKIYVEPENTNAINNCLKLIKKSKKPVILADIAFANGGDNELVKEILKENIFSLYSYAGWNTTGNTLGSAISAGLIRFFAETNNIENVKNVKKLLIIRLADDWAYQALVRQKNRAINLNADYELLKSGLLPYIYNLSEKINLPLTKIKVSFPWNRTFEAGIFIEC